MHVIWSGLRLGHPVVGIAAGRKLVRTTGVVLEINIILRPATIVAADAGAAAVAVVAAVVAAVAVAAIVAVAIAVYIIDRENSCRFLESKPRPISPRQMARIKVLQQRPMKEIIQVPHPRQRT